MNRKKKVQKQRRQSCFSSFLLIFTSHLTFDFQSSLSWQKQGTCHRGKQSPSSLCQCAPPKPTEPRRSHNSTLGLYHHLLQTLGADCPEKAPIVNFAPMTSRRFDYFPRQGIVYCDFTNIATNSKRHAIRRVTATLNSIILL